MAKHMMAIGLKEKCMAEEFLNGLMGKNMKVTILWIKKKDMVYLYGMMVKNMKGNGLMGNSMVKEYLLILMDKLEKDNGFKIIYILTFLNR